MKKYLLIAVLLVSGLSLGWAFTDLLPPSSANGCVPVSNGYDYKCTTDSGAPSPALPSSTKAQLVNLTPGTTNALRVCSDCVQSVVVISSGVGTGAWVSVSSSAVSRPN